MNSGISSGKTGTVRSHPGGALVSIAAAAGIVAGAYLLRGSLRQYEQLGYLGIFLISLIGNATIVIPLPAPLIAFVGGSLYQALPAGLTAAAGA